MCKLAIVAVVHISFCLSLHAGSKCGDDVEFSPFSGGFVRYHNVIAYDKVRKGKSVNAREHVGKRRPRPNPLTPNDDLFKQGEELYKEKKYQEAVQILLKLYELDNQNPFVLNAIARSYYNIKGSASQSINTYLALMKVIENGYFDSEKHSVTLSPKKRKSEDVVVMWFTEAYWKLGTLYLDYEEYEKAVIEMSKIYYIDYHVEAKIGADDRLIATQLFSFLAESYFMLKNKEANNYFHCRTMEIDPDNKYVGKFLLK
jgi:tetratricopeptide (TPR) repeat protein